MDITNYLINNDALLTHYSQETISASFIPTPRKVLHFKELKYRQRAQRKPYKVEMITLCNYSSEDILYIMFYGN